MVKTSIKPIVTPRPISCRRTSTTRACCPSYTWVVPCVSEKKPPAHQKPVGQSSAESQWARHGDQVISQSSLVLFLSCSTKLKGPLTLLCCKALLNAHCCCSTQSCTWPPNLDNGKIHLKRSWNLQIPRVAGYKASLYSSSSSLPRPSPTRKTNVPLPTTPTAPIGNLSVGGNLKR